MDTPMPSADWGRWRYEAVTVLGRQVIPARTMTERDRARINERASKGHDDRDNDDDDTD